MTDQTLLLDGHVHYYDCYPMDSFFDSALVQMERFGKNADSQKSKPQKILLFTEGKENNFFSLFKGNAPGLSKSGYSFKATGEDESIILMRNGVPQCYIIRGRQIVTRENLEVLAIATKRDIADGLPIRQVIEQLIEQEDIAVLAWGTGKWLLKRGKIIRNLLNEYRSPFLLLGDNSARPGFWLRPIPFQKALKSGTPIISGSDPLPFPHEFKKAGSYGFSLKGEFDPHSPAASIRQLLSKRPLKIDIWGSRDGSVQFFRRQLKMFLKKYV